MDLESHHREMESVRKYGDMEARRQRYAHLEAAE